jgi:phosphate starvation-inducible PhoH-like protein
MDSTTATTATHTAMTIPFFTNYIMHWFVSTALIAGLFSAPSGAFLHTSDISSIVRQHAKLPMVPPFFYRTLIPTSSLLQSLFPPKKVSLMMRAARGDAGGNPKKEKYPIKALSPTYQPKGANQRRYVHALHHANTSLVVNLGPAGTGKTLFACHAAVQSLRRGDIQKIILTRPVVSVEEEIGFLPGNLISKMDPWTRPIFDILLECYSQSEIDTMMRAGVIEISPLAFMRGRTFKKAFILADEMQNSSPNQMFMLITRIGQGSKMVITGDLKQSDRGVDNGLADFVRKLRAKPMNATNPMGIELVEMGREDVERSPLVKQLLELYETPASPPVQKSPTPRRSRSPAKPSPEVSGCPVLYTTNTSLASPSSPASIDSPYVVIQTNDTATPSSAMTSKAKKEVPSDSALIPNHHVPKSVHGKTGEYYSFAETRWDGW